MAASTLIDMVRVLSSTAGTGLTITLGAAVASYLGTSVLTDGALYAYIIEDQNGTGREVGQGTYHASGTTFDRTTVIASTNSGARINLSGNEQIGFGALSADILNKRGDTLNQGALNWAAAVTIPSAATVNIGNNGGGGAATSNYVIISGTVAITAFDTIAQGAMRWVRFTGVLTLTNNASILLPGGVSITTAAGDIACMVSEGGGVWRCVDYTPVGGIPLLVPNNLSDVASKSTAFNNISPITSRGDIITGGAAGISQRLGLGANNSIPVSNATDLLYSTLSAWFDNVLGSTAGLVPQRGASLWAGVALGGALVPAADIRTASATITIPSGATKCLVILVGGGAGGGVGSTASGCVCPPTASIAGAGGPGGPGGVVVKYLSGLTPGNTLALTIGAAGTGGTSNVVSGNPGGDTTLASGSQAITTLTAGKGSGGGSVNAGLPGAIGAGGTGTNGDLNITGGDGIANGAFNIASSGGGFSMTGATGFGLGPSRSSGVAGSGQNGLGYGGAGSGSANGTHGGNGAAGAAIFFWYI